MVLELQVVEQLEPQIFKFVRVVLEQLEVVAHRRENLIELRLELTIVLRHQNLLRLLHLGLVSFLALINSGGRVVDHAGGGRRIVVNDDEPVLFRVLVQLVFHCAHDAVDLLAEEVKQLLRCYFWTVLRLLLQTLLLLNDLRNLRVVVLEIRGRLPIVQIDQHVCQV